MQLSTTNDVQIYNLSAGKSIPKWMSGEARRKLEKKNLDVRRRIQLIQDFEMPDISHTVDVSPDGRYVFATGAYKPWLKCYDLHDLSLKFERGLDADVVKVLVLSDDYSKVIILEEDRYLEMHASFGRYFRMRMPRYGRDMAYSRECSDLYLVGASSEIYRLNLEQGEWLSPLQSASSQINCCQFANDHQLFVCGTTDGTVEAWDHRDRNRVAVLDCAVPLLDECDSAEVTSLKFRDALHLGVGMGSGHVMLFDLRSRKPLIVKDHNYGLPIRNIDFVNREEGDIVLSMDSRVLKMWHMDTGKPFAAIETEHSLTDFTRYPNSGLIFIANEAPKMQQHFVPALGPAPKWCSFLETLTEELEETAAPTVYDDYKFVTRKQLEDLGLAHLIGSSVLRAYMHGYFMDARLYNKAQTLTQPFAYEKYKERKVKDILDEERETNVISKKEKAKLPKVNKELALRLQRDAKAAEKEKAKTKDKKKADTASSILADDRFKSMFEQEDFQVDEDSEQFQRLTKQNERSGVPSTSVAAEEESGDEEGDEGSAAEDSDEDIPVELPMDDELRPEFADSDLESVESSDDEENENKGEAAKKRKERMERRAEKFFARQQAEEEEKERRLASKPKKFVLHELASGETSKKFMEETVTETKKGAVPMALKKKKEKKAGQLEHVEETAFGGRSMTFTLEKKGKAAREEREKKKQEMHKKERGAVVRRTTDQVTKNLKRLPANLNLGRPKRK